MATVLTPSAQKVILHDVSWESYERLLADFANSSAPRLTFDRGTLEIMSPLPEHEEYNRALALLVEVVAEEWDLDLRNLGSTTFKSDDLRRGFEPDSCFYIQNSEKVTGKQRIDLRFDPPPDLVVEIDISSPSLNKLPIYAQLGVPEVWRYAGAGLSILALEGGTYSQCEESRVLPPINCSILTGFIEDLKSLRRPEWARKVREWARSCARHSTSPPG